MRSATDKDDVDKCGLAGQKTADPKTALQKCVGLVYVSQKFFLQSLISEKQSAIKSKKSVLLSPPMMNICQ